MTRQTFTFQSGAPVQDQPSARGGSRGAQVIGGASQGSVVTPGLETNAGPVGAQLGQFFEGLMQPYIQRKQEERFSQGFAAAQSGIALDELSHPDNPVNKIFGPSGYEQGAQMYAASTAVSTWQRNQVEDMDNLQTLESQDLAKHIADTSSAMKTGDPFADQMIQKGLFDATGPLLNTIAKRHDLWQQTRAVNAGTDAILSQGASMQALVTQQLALSGGSPEEDAANTATLGSLDGLFGIMGKPIGMHDESYQKMLVGAVRGLAQAGNGFAVGAMKVKGFWGLMDADDQDKMDELVLKFGSRANMEMAGRADFADRLRTHDAKVQRGDFNSGEGPADLDRINDDIKRATGFDVDVFDAKDLRAEGHTITSAAIAADNKRQDRAYEQFLRKQDWDHDAQVKRDDEASKVSLATIAWTSGNPVQAIAGGADHALIEAQANNDWLSGNNKNIIRNFNLGYIPDAVKKSAMSQVDASVGEQYNQNFERTYKQWGNLYKEKPAAALAFYGPYHVVMQKYDSLVKGHTDPITAFAKTFGDASQYGAAEVGPERRKEADKAISGVLSSQATWNPWGLTDLGSNGNNVVKQTAFSYVAKAGNNSAQGTKGLMDESIEAATASGEFERYGQFAVRNKAGTKPVGQMLGLGARDSSAVFTNVYNNHMKLVGASPNTDPDSLIRYDDNGHPAFIAVVKDKHGQTRRAIIQYSELATEAHNYVSDRTAQGRSPRRISFNDPAWDAIEAPLEKKYGLPKGGMKAIRTRGERSNSDQVSPVGASTVYQVMPETAAAIKAKYGVDAFSGPKGAAEAAAITLRDGMHRTGSWRGGVTQYIGGTDTAHHGPVTRAYVDRVIGMPAMR
jgi:hypothetical protein